MDQITDTGIIMMVLISDLLIITGVAIVLLISRSMAERRPDNSDRLVRWAYIASTIMTIIFGIFAETVIVLTMLYTVGLI